VLASHGPPMCAAIAISRSVSESCGVVRIEAGGDGDSTLVATYSDARKAWAEAHSVYSEAAEVVLKKERQDSHDLDVVEALGREAQRALNEYRIARGERGK
jgi:transglutaminase/protease-like cytokinesis protein 3